MKYINIKMIFSLLKAWGFNSTSLGIAWERLRGEGDCSVPRYLWYSVSLLWAPTLTVGRFSVSNRDREARLEVETAKHVSHIHEKKGRQHRIFLWKQETHGPHDSLEKQLFKAINKHMHNYNDPSNLVHIFLYCLINTASFRDKHQKKAKIK